MNNMIEQLLPDNIANLKAYSSAKSEKIAGNTWLNANESPFSQTINLSLDTLNRYPEPQPEAVIQAYADYAQVSSDNVLMTRGADEGIELLIRTFCQPKQDSIAIFLPTYGMYKVTADSHDVKINALTQLELQTGSVAALVKEIGSSKLVFICNPNNPTGEMVSIERIKEISAQLGSKTLLVVDEAYIEFCPEQSAVSLINELSNVIVLRTLSKAFALAGLRCGFTLSRAEILAPIRKVIAPYPVSSVVATIAEQALRPQAIASMREQVSELNQLKQNLFTRCKQSSAIERVLSGEGNFVTVKLVKRSVLSIAQEMGLIMRPFTLFGQDDWLRISIGNQAELNQVTVWLDAINQQ